MRLVLWFMAVAALFFGIWSVWGGSWSDDFTLTGSVKWLQRAGPWAWAAGIALLAGDLVLPIPGTIVISALGYIYGAFLGGLVAVVGLVAAGFAGYGVGRLLGEPFARRWLGNRDFEKGQRLFTRRGGWLVAVSRALPILPEVISCSAGLMRMPVRQFTAALLCGSVPMGFVFASVGQAGRHSPGWAMGLSVLIPPLLWLAANRIWR